MTLFQMRFHSECLVQALNNGQVWVEHSREHTSFRHDWISDVDLLRLAASVKIGVMS